MDDLDFDYDYYYLLKIEQRKLEKMKEYFQKYSIINKKVNNIIIRDISICIKLIDIINEDNNNDNYIVNMKNAYRFDKYMADMYSKYETGQSYIRQHKALHLYSLIREYKMLTWWD